MAHSGRFDLSLKMPSNPFARGRSVARNRFEVAVVLLGVQPWVNPWAVPCLMLKLRETSARALARSLQRPPVRERSYRLAAIQSRARYGLKIYWREGRGAPSAAST